MDAALYVAIQQRQVLARALDRLGLRGAAAPINDRRHEAEQTIAAPSREHEARPAETHQLHAPRTALEPRRVPDATELDACEREHDHAPPRRAAMRRKAAAMVTINAHGMRVDAQTRRGTVWLDVVPEDAASVLPCLTVFLDHANVATLRRQLDDVARALAALEDDVDPAQRDALAASAASAAEQGRGDRGDLIGSGSGVTSRRGGRERCPLTT